MTKPSQEGPCALTRQRSCLGDKSDLAWSWCFGELLFTELLSHTSCISQSPALQLDILAPGAAGQGRVRERGKRCIQTAAQRENRIFGKQRIPRVLQIRYSSPSFSRSSSVFLNIICNLGKQNLASTNKIIILAGGGGRGSDLCCEWQPENSPVPCSGEWQEERKLPGRPQTQLPFCCWEFELGEKKYFSWSFFHLTGPKNPLLLLYRTSPQIGVTTPKAPAPPVCPQPPQRCCKSWLWDRGVYKVLLPNTPRLLQSLWFPW